MALIDQGWSRIAGLRPRLHAHVRVERVRYRGEPWYLLYDEASGRSHRVPPSVYRLVCLLDGRHQLQQIFDALQQGEEPPDRDAVFRVYNQLRSAELLQGDGQAGDRADLALLDHQREHWERMRRRQRFASPLSLRFPLWDPDDFLVRTLPLVRPLFSAFGALLWLLVVGWGLLLAGRHWSDLTHNLADVALAPDNLVVLLLVYPLIKLLHELGHAWITRSRGGEVHEMGMMLLVFMPVPYVEASSANAFPERRARMAVSAAGILVELFLAGLAMIVWSQVEPGLVRSIAFNVMLIGGVSTLLFNGNPLLRFDGYYVFSDAIGMPNLGPRSSRFLGYLVQRHAFGLTDIPSPAQTRGEALWMVSYGIASFIYRVFISLVIILFVAGKFFVLGMAIAAWAIHAMLLMPLWRGLRYLVTSPSLARRRARALGVALTLLGLTFVLLFQWPVPIWSNAQGVVWLPPEAQLRTESAGFCRELLVQSGDPVGVGQPILRLEDDELSTRRQVIEADLRELEVRYQAIWRSDRTTARVLRKKIEAVEADLARVEQRLQGLILRSTHAGRIHLPMGERLLGRWLAQGDLVAYVLQPPLQRVRASLGQSDISLLRQGVERVEVRLAEQPERVYLARIAREVPAASRELPSAALGRGAGGRIPVDPADPEGLRSWESVFHIDLTLPPDARVSGVGGRVHIRFQHRPEPLAQQWYRSLRQLLLRRFAV